MDPTQNPTDGAAAPVVDDDASEWDDVSNDFLADRGIESEEDKPKEQETIDEQAKSKEEPEGEEAKKPNPEDKKSDEESKPGNEADKATGKEAPKLDADGKPITEPKPGEEGPEQAATPEPALSPEAQEKAQRRAQLELEADRKELAKDIREKMFSDKPSKLLDSEGLEIKTPQDVTRYKNPVTGKNFTIEEGSQWLMLAQNKLEKDNAEDQKTIDSIVEQNLTLKEEADEVREKFGEFLDKNPGLRKQIWEDYKATFQLSADGEVIVKAPVSMKRFYTTVLQPHATFAQQQADAAATKEVADKKAADEAAAKQVKAEKKENQSDREDVFSTRTKTHEGMDPEEKEWAEEAKAYYEN